MFKANIKFHDGSVLNDVFLYREQSLWTSIITDKTEAKDLFGKWNTIYFGNDVIQGGFIPAYTESFELIELNELELLEYHIQKLLHALEEKKKTK